MASNKVKAIRRAKHKENLEIDEAEKSDGLLTNVWTNYWSLVDSGKMRGSRDKRIRRNMLRRIAKVSE